MPICSEFYIARLGMSNRAERLIFPERARANVPMDLLTFDKAAEVEAREYETETRSETESGG